MGMYSYVRSNVDPAVIMALMKFTWSRDEICVISSKYNRKINIKSRIRNEGEVCGFCFILFFIADWLHTFSDILKRRKQKINENVIQRWHILFQLRNLCAVNRRQRWGHRKRLPLLDERQPFSIFACHRITSSPLEKIQILTHQYTIHYTHSIRQIK